MAASANPSGNHHQEQSSFNGGHAASTSNGNSGQGYDNSGTASAMKHNPGIATDWTTEEQTILENGLTQYASLSGLSRYAKIAMELPSKTVRDVALRARWMNKKEIGKRRKDDHTRKNKDKREKITESSSKSSQLHASRPGAHPYPVPAVPLDDDDGISYKAIGGHTGELLEKNKQVFHQISANLASYQIQENINLLCQARENIFRIMNNVNDTPDIMKQMPPLPVKLNEELASAILPSTNHQKQQS
ncbi:DnaJ-like protein subfamily C member 2 [Bienertia sinuspersici]